MAAAVVRTIPPGVVLPPPDYRSCVGIVCNGQMESSLDLETRIKSCGKMIGVDGGLNHCHRMRIKPTWLVGDFDSVSSDVLKEMSEGADADKLQRAKDFTDLEVAVQKAKTIADSSLMIIFAGLGGRIDHTLGNIYLLLRNAGCAMMDSENQIIFAINAANGKVQVSHAESQTLAICTLSGTARQVVITTEEGTIVHPTLKGGSVLISPFSKNAVISVEEGELIICLDRRRVLPLTELPSTGDLRVSFLIDQPVINTLQYLSHQAAHFSTVRLITEKEVLANIQPSSGMVPFTSIVGQTISLIPLFGPVTGITSDGLKWELGATTIDSLSRDFVGISNVSMKPKFTVRVGDGMLLCVVNTDLIDAEMVAAELPTIEKDDDKKKETSR